MIFCYFSDSMWSLFLCMRWYKENKRESRMEDWMEVSSGAGITANRPRWRVLLPLSPVIDRMTSHGTDIYLLFLRMI